MSTATPVSQITAGTVIRLFGPDPSATVVAVDRAIMQGMRYLYTLTLDDGSRFTRWQDEAVYVLT